MKQETQPVLCLVNLALNTEVCALLSPAGEGQGAREPTEGLLGPSPHLESLGPKDP